MAVTIDKADSLPLSPRASTSKDHSYSTMDSPQKLKRRLDDSVALLQRTNKKIKYQHKKNQRLKQKVKSLQSVVASLRKAHLVSETCANHLERTSSGVPLQLLKRIQGKNGGRLSREAYHPDLVKFALTLQFYSTKAYNYVRKHFALALLHVSTIRRWYSAIDGSPGFTQEAFASLRLKVEEANRKGEEVVCSLMLDEMSIMRHLDFDGNRVIGYVDIGTQVDDDSLPKATGAGFSYILKLRISQLPC